MNLSSLVKQYPNVAIFCRNHKNLLDEAVPISDGDPTRQILFRAQKVWRSAEVAIHTHGPRPIYFLPIDDPDFCIKYVAKVEKVVLDPRDIESVRKLLKLSVPASQDEGLWDEDGKPTVRTLYLISNCHSLEKGRWMNFTKLKKLSDNKWIDESFGYSYAIVHEVSSLNQ